MQQTFSHNMDLAMHAYMMMSGRWWRWLKQSWQYTIPAWSCMIATHTMLKAEYIATLLLHA